MSTVKEFLQAAINDIFIIECEDIILREFRLEDLDELYALTLQPEITDTLPDWKATKEERRAFLINYHMKSNKEFLEAVPNIGDQWLNLGIILKETNEFIGWCCTGPKDELPEPNREIAYIDLLLLRLGKCRIQKPVRHTRRYIAEQELRFRRLSITTSAPNLLIKGFWRSGRHCVDDFSD